VTEAQQIKWPGVSGQEYVHFIYPIAGAERYAMKGGNYIFAKETRPGFWTPLYNGETGDLNDRLYLRLNEHHKLACVLAAGATHLHVKLTPEGENERLRQETDIRQRWHPSCNDQ
jgi:hypothetical protein